MAENETEQTTEQTTEQQTTQESVTTDEKSEDRIPKARLDEVINQRNELQKQIDEFNESKRKADEAEAIKGQPTVIIARTVKGKGVPFMEGQFQFHNAPITKQQWEEAMRLLATDKEVAR